MPSDQQSTHRRNFSDMSELGANGPLSPSELSTYDRSLSPTSPTQSNRMSAQSLPTATSASRLWNPNGNMHAIESIIQPYTGVQVRPDLGRKGVVSSEFATNRYDADDAEGSSADAMTVVTDQDGTPIRPPAYTPHVEPSATGSAVTTPEQARSMRESYSQRRRGEKGSMDTVWTSFDSTTPSNVRVSVASNHSQGPAGPAAGGAIGDTTLASTTEEDEPEI